MPPGARPTMMVIGLLGKSSACAGHTADDSRTATAIACRTILHIVPSSADTAGRLTPLSCPPKPQPSQPVLSPALLRRNNAAASARKKRAAPRPAPPPILA